jgi:hypothetical protein
LFTQERGDEVAAKLAAKFAEITREIVQARGGTCRAGSRGAAAGWTARARGHGRAPSSQTILRCAACWSVDQHAWRSPARV